MRSINFTNFVVVVIVIVVLSYLPFTLFSTFIVLFFYLSFLNYFQLYASTQRLNYKCSLLLIIDCLRIHLKSKFNKIELRSNIFFFFIKDWAWTKIERREFACEAICQNLSIINTGVFFKRKTYRPIHTKNIKLS